MNLKKVGMGVLLIGSVFLMASGCNNSSSVSTEQDQVQNNQDKLVTAVPLPNLSNSLERANISKRLQTFDDPNKVSYIYLINYGKVMAFYTIKGKVTSSTKRLTSDEKLAQDIDCGEYTCSNVVMEAPSLDGSYGASDEYIFFWTTDGVYVQWSGDYMEVDQPLKLQQQPELVQTINK